MILNNGTIPLVEPLGKRRAIVLRIRYLRLDIASDWKWSEECDHKLCFWKDLSGN
jgi:hypothetical protein